MRYWNRFPAVLAFALGISSGCQQAQTDSFSDSAAISAAQSSSNQSTVSAETLRKWDEYLKKEPLNKIQEECLPRHFPARAAYQGTVVLFHGFSACPQQFWEIGDKLAASGYEVFLPLLPGHGRIKIKPDQDNLDGLPQAHEWRKYRDHVDVMADMIRPSQGIHAVGGLSVGATLATHAMLSADTKDVWQRALIMAPLYNSIDDRRRLATEVLGNIPFLNQFFGHGWGEQCLNDSKIPFGPLGYVRGGFCNFKASHAAGFDNFGNSVIDLMQKYGRGEIVVPSENRIQFIFADFDQKTRPKSLNLALNALLNGKGKAKTTACSFGPPVPHSFISRYDAEKHVDPERNKPWLDTLISGGAGFLNSGTEVPTAIEKSTYPLANHCRLEPGQRASDTWPVPPRQQR